MATADRTGVIKDYLGHPCSIAPLLEERADGWGMDDLRKKDPRRLVQLIGDELAELVRRTGHSHGALEHFVKMLPDLESPHEGLESLLPAQVEYSLRTANLAFDLASKVLVALEHGNLIEPSPLPETPARG